MIRESIRLLSHQPFESRTCSDDYSDDDSALSGCNRRLHCSQKTVVVVHIEYMVVQYWFGDC